MTRAKTLVTICQIEWSRSLEYADDSKTGVLFDSNDPEILAEKIKPYVSGPIEQRQMGLAAMKFMESKFSCRSNSQRVFDLNKKIMAGIPPIQ